MSWLDLPLDEELAAIARADKCASASAECCVSQPAALQLPAPPRRACREDAGDSSGSGGTEDERKRKDVSLSVLRQLFGLSLTEAAQRLGMCRTTR
jgi:hypothetical protein